MKNAWGVQPKGSSKELAAKAKAEKEMRKLLQETEVDSVHLDVSVVMKVIKSCKDNMPDLVTGQLLGMDVGPILEVTNCFPFPRSADTDKEGEDEGAEYQMHMMRSLRRIHADAYTVGWYQSTYLGAFNDSMVETQFNYQTNPLITKKCVVLIYDPLRSRKSGFSLKAYRLTKDFVNLYEELSDDEGTKPIITQKRLASMGLTYASIFQEVPIKLSGSPLAIALCKQLSRPKHLKKDFKLLDLSSAPYLEKNMELLSEYLDELMGEQHHLQNYWRNLQRQAKAESKPDEKGSSRKKEEAPAPNRLDTLLISHQIFNYCKQLNEFAGQSVSKIFLTSKLRKTT